MRGYEFAGLAAAPGVGLRQVEECSEQTHGPSPAQVFQRWSFSGAACGRRVVTWMAGAHKSLRILGKSVAPNVISHGTAMKMPPNQYMKYMPAAMAKVQAIRPRSPNVDASSDVRLERLETSVESASCDSVPGRCHPGARSQRQEVAAAASAFVWPFEDSILTPCP